jgi:hypothetical protein
MSRKSFAGDSLHYRIGLIARLSSDGYSGEKKLPY